MEEKTTVGEPPGWPRKNASTGMASSRSSSHGLAKVIPKSEKGFMRGMPPSTNRSASSSNCSLSADGRVHPREFDQVRLFQECRQQRFIRLRKAGAFGGRREEFAGSLAGGADVELRGDKAPENVGDLDAERVRFHEPMRARSCPRAASASSRGVGGGGCGRLRICRTTAQTIAATMSRAAAAAAATIQAG